jgi:prolyl oligopeptidase
MTRLSASILFVATLALCVFAADQHQPVAPVRSATNTYFGTTVIDPYRYLENLADPEVAAWMKAQNDYARSVLDRIPGRKDYLARVQTLDNAVAAQVSDIRRLSNDRCFYCKRLPTDATAKLYVREGLTGKETLLVDPDTFTKATGTPYTISFYEPSWDGQYVAYGAFEAGSEDTVIHVVETATASETDKPIDRARFGNISWHPNGRSFFYNRLQLLQPGMSATARYEKSRVYLHVIGADADKEPPVFGFGVSPLVKVDPNDIPKIEATPISRYVLGVIDHETQERSVYVAPLASTDKPAIPWRKVCEVGDQTTKRVVRGDQIFLLTHKDAPQFKIVRTSLTEPNLSGAATVVPPSDAVVTGVAAAKDGLYVQLLDGGIGRLLRVPNRGKTESVELPVEGSVSIAACDSRREGVLLEIKSWIKAPQIYTYDPRTKKTNNTGLQPVGLFDSPADIESVEVKARSYDGTMIPLSIRYKRGITLDGSHPTALTGYGSWGISQAPSFSPVGLAWLENNGVVAVAHVRGGGEYGDDWYKAGYKLTKPNTWKDFIACAEYLIEHKYTSPQRLAAFGGSAGGILVGRAITDRPDLFAAAVISAGSLDMLRCETTAGGRMIVSEYGSTQTADGFNGLYEMSAYHHVQNATPYPAVMLSVGINDARVAPSDSAKMAARLQAATTSGKPVLLCVDYQAGHGVGAPKTRMEEDTADMASFLLWQFGLPAFQPPPSN